MREPGNSFSMLVSSADRLGDSTDIGELQEAIAAMREERHLLKCEIAFEQHKNALMRDALSKSRRAIEALQAATSAVAGASTDRARREAFRFPFSLTPGRRKETLDPKWYGRKRSDPSRYIAQSALEDLILRSAQGKVYGIRGVILEFGWNTHSACGSNWRIGGIVSGRADRAAAAAAVDDAVSENAAWVMVEDGSRLDGQPIENPGRSRS